jgi:capsular exopolysaccharide synthesis family protein
MRRAAEGFTEERQDVGLPNPNWDRDAEALAKEAFPVEVSESARERVPARTGSVSRMTIAAEEPPAGEPSAEEPTESRFHERFAEGLSEKIIGDPRMPPACTEQYRRLAAVLHDAQAVNQTQVVMVASAVAGEGKTLTAANVALTLSHSYRKRVLLIDADLRRPTLHVLFRIQASSGLADGLDPSSDKQIVVRQVTPRLALLPAGRPTTDPMAGLTSQRMRRLIDEARETFDWIIIDTPPLVLLPDANLLASIVDAALLVVKAESTPHSMVKRAVDAIGRPRLLGVVLNSATVSPHGSYGGYGYSYASAGSEIVSP